MRIVLLAFVALTMCSCGVLFPSRPDSLAGFKLVSAGESKIFLDSLKTKATSVNAARGVYEASISKGVGRKTLTQTLAFVRPGFLRLDFFATSLNQLVMLMVVREDFLEVFNTEEKILYRGRPTASNVAKLVGAPLMPEELMLWFLGILSIEDSSELGVMRNSETGHWGVSGKVNGKVWTNASFISGADGLGPRLLSLELRNEEKLEPFFFSTFSYAENEYPDKINFSLPEQSIEGKLVVKKLTINPEQIPLELFKIRTPEGIRVEPF